MTESKQAVAEGKPSLRDWRLWNRLAATVALLLTAAAVVLELRGVGWWPPRLAVTGTTFALLANALGRKNWRQGE